VDLDLAQGGVGDHVELATAGQVPQIGTSDDLAEHHRQGSRGSVGQQPHQIGTRPRRVDPGQPLLVLGPADPPVTDRSVQQLRGVVAIDIRDP
jgi:hypothetical protein